jgi:hypothetical protein
MKHRIRLIAAAVAVATLVLLPAAEALAVGPRMF